MKKTKKTITLHQFKLKLIRADSWTKIEPILKRGLRVIAERDKSPWSKKGLNWWLKTSKRNYKGSPKNWPMLKTTKEKKEERDMLMNKEAEMRCYTMNRFWCDGEML